MSFAHFQQLIYHRTDLESAASRQVHTLSTCQQPLTSPVSAKFMAHRRRRLLPSRTTLQHSDKFWQQVPLPTGLSTPWFVNSSGGRPGRSSWTVLAISLYLMGRSLLHRSRGQVSCPSLATVCRPCLLPYAAQCRPNSPTTIANWRTQQLTCILASSYYSYSDTATQCWIFYGLI